MQTFKRSTGTKDGTRETEIEFLFAAHLGIFVEYNSSAPVNVSRKEHNYADTTRKTEF